MEGSIKPNPMTFARVMRGVGHFLSGEFGAPSKAQRQRFVHNAVHGKYNKCKFVDPSNNHRRTA